MMSLSISHYENEPTTDRCVHVLNGAKPVLVVGEDDSFGPVTRIIICDECRDAEGSFHDIIEGSLTAEDIAQGLDYTDNLERIEVKRAETVISIYVFMAKHRMEHPKAHPLRAIEQKFESELRKHRGIDVFQMVNDFELTRKKLEKTIGPDALSALREKRLKETAAFEACARLREKRKATGSYFG